MDLPLFFLTMVTVNYSFQGTELVGIAAGESEDPAKTLPRSIRNIIWRTMFFFVLAIFVLVALIPWEEAGLTKSPFVAVFDNIGIPYAADIMNFVILTAVLSVANSGLYAATRMLWSLSKRNGSNLFKEIIITWNSSQRFNHDDSYFCFFSFDKRSSC